LKVEEIVQIREEEMDGVLINDILLGELCCIFLKRKCRHKVPFLRGKRRGERTCMISKPSTYFRSVSMISLVMYIRLDSRAFVGGGGGRRSWRESDESCADSVGGDGGASSKASTGR
jgi:hypothetical protein